MKSVFIAGSRKFFGDVDKLVDLMTENKIKVSTAGKIAQKDIPKGEKSALARAFQRINESDVLYIVAKDGYIGKTVALEIAYAFANKKEIISSEIIGEFSARALVSKVMGFEELAEYVIQKQVL